MVSFPPVSPPRPYYIPLSSPIRATCPAHLIHLDFITRTILSEEYKSFSSSLCSLLHSPVTSSLLGPNILLNTMFSNTLSYLSSLNVSDQASHPYKTHAGGPPLVGCPRLLIQFIRSYPPYRRPFLNPQPEDAPCRGDRDSLHGNYRNRKTKFINWNPCRCLGLQADLHLTHILKENNIFPILCIMIQFLSYKPTNARTSSELQQYFITSSLTYFGPHRPKIRRSSIKVV